MKKMLPAILLFSCFAFAKCNKGKKTPPPDNPYGLPNATQTGENIFACRVNGENWISKKGIFYMGGGIFNDTLAVRAGRNLSAVEGIYLLTKDSISEGRTYYLDSLTKIVYTTTRLCNFNIIKLYDYSGINGSIKLSKVDSTNKIISGTFSFSIYRQECNDTLHFTEGRFDIRYY